MFNGIYHGRRVLVLGHTGFKGSWLTAWLQQLGARVTGIALPPNTTPSHWDVLGLSIDQHYHDIRDGDALKKLIGELQPEMVFHLAAQPLVRYSYAEPVETWATNLMGTVNVLEACRTVDSVKAIVVVTSDKCYENRETETAYVETDRLGGHDPYSASKAAAELAVTSYRQSFFNQADAPLIATARAGNVIGGGDWSEDRLIPDLDRSITGGKLLMIRSPNATRPWQHVLESLSGYLLLGQKLLEGKKEFADAWNFGPSASDNCSVVKLLQLLADSWPAVQWQVAADASLHEAQFLMVDSSKVHQALGWQPVWKLADALAATAAWYKSYHHDGRVETHAQLQDFMTAARLAKRSWSLA